MRGLSLALIAITLAALAVSFLSSAKARGKAYRIAHLQQEVEKSAQTQKALEEKLREAEQKSRQEASAVQELKEALAQEQVRSAALAQGLGRQQEAGEDEKEIAATKFNFTSGRSAGAPGEVSSNRSQGE